MNEEQEKAEGGGERGDVFRQRSLLLEYKPLRFDSVRRLEKKDCEKVCCHTNMHVHMSFEVMHHSAL